MKIFLDIIVLLLSLSVLVCLHELGHLLVAKAFKVYCAEYSIGMGPLLFKVKKPGQETQFSIRMLPIGGYVAMAGEGSEEIEEFKDVPQERFLTGVARWKRALIMVAGVTVNFILALLLFMGSGLASPILDENKRTMIVHENTTTPYLAETAGLTNDDNIKNIKFVFTRNGEEEVVEKKVEDGRDLYTAANLFNITDSGYYGSELSKPLSMNDTWRWVLTTDTDKVISFNVTPVEVKIKNPVDPDELVLTWDTTKIGIDFHTRQRNFNEAMNRAGDEFITSVTSFSVLFQEGGWKNLGGVISVFQVSSMATDVGFYYYLYVWGFISLNLAIVNLLPFPGLDGWHLVVCAFEGLFRRDMPAKAKQVMSTIGMVLLFGLMIFVTVLDLLRL